MRTGEFCGDCFQKAVDERFGDMASAINRSDYRKNFAAARNKAGIQHCNSANGGHHQ
jgi:hypothetical protein